MGQTLPSGLVLVDDAVVKSAIAKAARRLLPFLLLLYVLAFLDRVNVGYAKQALLRDTGISEAVYAFGASIFFVGYAIFEIPSNLVLHRVGARVWLCRIMITWGLVSAAMMFTTNALSFYLLRLLLGIAEAGFFPGVILYLTYWFPAKSRGPMLGLFYFGAPLAQIFGGPVSGLLLEMEGIGNLHGWQWMFLVEGLMAVIVGIWTFSFLTDRPADAAWMTAAEREGLQAVLQSEELAKGGHGMQGIVQMLRQPGILHYACTYLLIQMSVYGVTFYLPANVARLLGRDTGFVVGLVSAIPWICAFVAAFALPRFAARTGQRQLIAGGALILAAVGIAISSSGTTAVALPGLCLATAGFIGAQPIFWTFPTGQLSGANAAAGIALINSAGAVGGFLAPNVKTVVASTLSSATAGQLALAMTSILAGSLMFATSAREKSSWQSR